jgi:SSS family solute:Na+ symporter
MAYYGIYGVILGMLAKVAASQGMFAGTDYRCDMDSEMGLPILLATILPVGLGLMLSSYFSAILSTVAA